MSRAAWVEIALFLGGLVAVSAFMLGCATMPEAQRQRHVIAAEFERCARSLSDAQCAIVYRERCILHGLGADCYADLRW
jgi:hypothetical protein